MKSIKSPGFNMKSVKSAGFHMKSGNMSFWVIAKYRSFFRKTKHRFGGSLTGADEPISSGKKVFLANVC